jgi:TRAP-type C4-dicarboxylate transport system permease large subunit
MVMLIIIFAAIFSHVIALIGAPKALLSTVIALGLPKWALFTVVFSFLLVIAYALEELSVMIILLPISSAHHGLGSAVWFGVIMVVWLEIIHHAAVGLDLFVIRAHARHRRREVTVGTLAYALILLVVILFAFGPGALVAPHMMPGRR